MIVQMISIWDWSSSSIESSVRLDPTYTVVGLKTKKHLILPCSFPHFVRIAVGLLYQKQPSRPYLLRGLRRHASSATEDGSCS